MSREALMELVEQQAAEQATGCGGAGSYRDYAKSQGYPFCEVLDWTSSAGDWTFLISKDGHEWQVLYQENNWPRAGFTYTIDTEVYHGTAEEAMQVIEDLYY